MGRAAVPDLITHYCKEQHWITNLFTTDAATYREWVVREQLNFILDDVLQSTPLRECFRDFAATEFKHNAAINPTLALDLLLEINAYDATRLDEERPRAACRIWKDFIKVGAERVPGSSDVGLTAGVRAEIQRLVQADTNDVCSATSTAKGLFAAVEREVRGALKVDEVPEAFLVSSAYHKCLSSDRVQNDIGSFSRVEDAYCADERRAYENGTPERRADTERAIRAGWLLECESDPSFAPPEIVAARQQD